MLAISSCLYRSNFATLSKDLLCVHVVISDRTLLYFYFHLPNSEQQVRISVHQQW